VSARCRPTSSRRSEHHHRRAKVQIDSQPAAYASIVCGAQLRRRVDGPTLRLLIVDVALAGIAVYAACLLTAEILAATNSQISAAAAYTTAALHGATVAIRRLAPGVAVVGLLTTAGIYALALNLPVFMLGPAVLFVAYAVGSRLPRRPAMISLGMIELALVALLALGPSFPGWDSVVLFAGVVAGSWVLGFLSRRWQTMAAENAQRAHELEQARTELARSEVAAERLRIARELHDVVAHSMSVIAMHAGAARLAVGTDPNSERAALDVIERSSRDALGEMRRLVTLLRDEDANDATRNPLPGLAELHTLVANVVAAGLTVDVRTEGDLEAVPTGVSLAGYRVIQEALTNVVRHAGRTQARLFVGARQEELIIKVQNDGPIGAPTRSLSASGRHGAIGMRERIQLYGGTLTAGPTSDSGWSVDARLPYAAAER
jgi:signal transduction histidine kinase